MEYQGNLRIKVDSEDKEKYEVFSGESNEHRFTVGFSGVRNWDLVVNELNPGGVVGRPFIKANIYPVRSFSEIRFYAGSVYGE